MTTNLAPGKPGIVPKWTSSAKIGVGTAMSGDSDVWFTISHGIVNEVYYPRIDLANIRDMGLIVTDGKEYFSEEKRHAIHDYALVADGVPAYKLTNTCKEQRYRIQKTIITDPSRNVLLQEVEFVPLQGTLEDYRVFVVLAPHIANAGYGNTGWSGHYKGTPMLFAHRRNITLACACAPNFLHMNCGYVGSDSDTWRDVYQNKKMTCFYSRAEDGNIALGAEINLKGNNGKFLLALGFARGHDEAGLQTRTSLAVSFTRKVEQYVEDWQRVQGKCTELAKVDEKGGALHRMSTAVIKTHQGKHLSGSVIASLSIPWGFSKGDNDLGGYHLIWPRDQVETAHAFLAAHDHESARQVLLFLMCTQECDGHWAQCFWEDGAPYWHGLQMDETALPILLADQFRRIKCLDLVNPWPMVEKAARFIIRNGPATDQDRWEEAAGYTAYTLSAQIAALLAAADFFDLHEKKASADYLRGIADWWNDNIENWLYVSNTDVARKHGVEGYYVRISPTGLCESKDRNQIIRINNRPADKTYHPYSSIVSVDALALVRFGLRDGNDPRIRNTVKVIDSMLKKETIRGPIWHRYNEDGYGEHDDGSPFDGTGVGRGWPLLIGERAHYELACGHKEEAIRLLRTMASMAGVGGLFPEQIWDAPDIPEKSLFNGHSAGAAKPLVWAHAEYISLLRSIKDNKVFSTPPQPLQRYIVDKTKSSVALWRFENKIHRMPSKKKLRIQAYASAIIHWSIDNWRTCIDTKLTALPDLGIHYVDLPVGHLPAGSSVDFTFFWPESNKWEGSDFKVEIQ